MAWDGGVLGVLFEYLAKEIEDIDGRVDTWQSRQSNNRLGWNTDQQHDEYMLAEEF